MSIRKGGKILATGGSSVKDQNTKQVLKFWSGTLKEYEALGEWSDDCLYTITDDDLNEMDITSGIYYDEVVEEEIDVNILQSGYVTKATLENTVGDISSALDGILGEL